MILHYATPAALFDAYERDLKLYGLVSSMTLYYDCVQAEYIITDNDLVHERQVAGRKSPLIQIYTGGPDQMTCFIMNSYYTAICSYYQVQICTHCSRPIGMDPRNHHLFNGFSDAANGGVFVCFSCRDQYYLSRNKTNTHV